MQIEKTLVAKLKAEERIPAQFTEAEFKAELRLVYLEKLESKAISSHPQMSFFDPEGNKKYSRYRTIVLSVMAIVESKINHLLRLRIDPKYTILPMLDSKSDEAIQEILGGLQFSKKVDCAFLFYGEKIKKNFLFTMGQIRNAFAHTLPLSSDKYRFKKKNVVIDVDAFIDFVELAFDEIDGLQDLIEEQPEYKRFREVLDARIKIIEKEMKDKSE